MNATNADDVQQLERCISDLIAVLGSSVSWRERSAEYVLNALCDMLLRVLRLSFVYAGLYGEGDVGGYDAARIEARHGIVMQPQDLKAIVAPWLQRDRYLSGGIICNPLEAGTLAVSSVQFGLHTRLGNLVTAASRSDYPSRLELLLLRVAVNQASAVLQGEANLQMRQRAAAELEAKVAKRTEQLLVANQQQWELKGELAAELGAMACLHEFSARLLLAGDLQVVLDETLVAVMGLQSADFGNVQLNDPEQGGLVIAAQRNFQAEFLEYFALVSGDDSACGRAAGMRARVVIEDVETDESFAPHRRIAAAAGFRAVQSTPLISHRGELLGMISTHFRKPHVFSDTELRLTDLYARHATQMIERNRAEDERGKLASIVENSADFIGITSLTGKALFLNAAGRRMVGLRDGEPILDNIQSYIASEDRERLTTQILPAVERAGFWDGEIHLRNIRTGQPVPVLQHIFYTRESRTGRPLALATVCRDISERRRAEQAASQAQQELAHAARVLSMGELTTSIAHEINQPLTAIVANGNACRRWIERDVPDLEQARTSLNNIVRDANRASDVIGRIRAFSAKATVSRSSVDVNDVVREVLALTSNEMRREQVALHTRLSSHLPEVIADRVELQQVVLNLVINSIESMRTIAGRPRALLITSGERNASMVEVAVCDNGAGMGDPQLSQIFEAFFTTKPQGMGLGLSISRRIIETHGGKLRAAANPDYGLTLSFTLPADSVARHG